jgi:uncharacterized integral membrane protein
MALQIIYLCLFACFGATATCFVQFTYAFWVKGEMKLIYIKRAVVGVLLAIICYLSVLFIQ